MRGVWVFGLAALGLWVVGCGPAKHKSTKWTWLHRNANYAWREQQATYGNGQTLDVSLPVDLKPAVPKGAVTLRFKGPIDEIDIVIDPSQDVMKSAEELGQQLKQDDLTMPERLKNYTLYVADVWEQPQGDKDPDHESEPIDVDGTIYHSGGMGILIPTSHKGESITVLLMSNEDSAAAFNELTYICDWIAVHNNP